jgi:hypothetical protein
MKCKICNNEHTEVICPACSYNGQCVSNVETAIDYFKKLPNKTPWQNKILLFGEIDKVIEPRKSNAKKSVILNISPALFSRYYKVFKAYPENIDIFLEKTFDDAYKKIHKPNVETGKELFKTENELQKHLLANWDIYFPEWDFHKEYYVVDSSNEIDILAKHKLKNEILIIENKLDIADEKALAQLLRYMGAVKGEYNDFVINGLLVACDINETILESLQFVINTEIKVFNSMRGKLILEKPIMPKYLLHHLKHIFINNSKG